MPSKARRGRPENGMHIAFARVKGDRVDFVLDEQGYEELVAVEIKRAKVGSRSVKIVIGHIFDADGIICGACAAVDFCKGGV